MELLEGPAGFADQVPSSGSRRPVRHGFFCEEHKLVVELDGHSHDTTASEDSEREWFLTAQGFRVIRFMNNDVVRDVRGVVQAIGDAVEAIRKGKF